MERDVYDAESLVNVNVKKYTCFVIIKQLISIMSLFIHYISQVTARIKQNNLFQCNKKHYWC